MTYDAGIETNQENRTLAMVACVIGIFSNFIGPLIVWLIKRDQSRFVAFHALQALLFNVVVLVAHSIAAALWVVLIGFPLSAIVGITHIVLLIIAAMAAMRGEWYEIPLVGKYARQAVLG